ncbi:MAG TPA: GxxExxY protein [Candidatus Hydrogenedentes bacterium]|nr:GxxExxY protein [Candidatus Hydrogenedentota bacterium]HOL76446.1 GxxExxY protein [Candidatus Hydrogenedentota bacterium]HPO85484.1 GxxExxY protein [Candidatus Hydrogenedentota bacterium]
MGSPGALEWELRLRNVPYEAQTPIQIAYKGYVLSKEYIPDFVCFEQVIVEIKALKQLTSVEEARF